MKKFSLGMVLTLAFMVFISCKKDAASPTPTPTPNTVDVSILALSYSPATVTVTKGTIVRWTNNGGTTHTVTSDNGTSFNSSNIASGNTYSLTTTVVGSFPYHCLIHGVSMAGTLNVTN